MRRLVEMGPRERSAFVAVTSCVLVCAPRLGLLAVALTTSCGGISQLDHTGNDPCTKTSCAGDSAFIGGNLDVGIDTPVRVRIETCIDGVCAEPIELEPGPLWSRSNLRMVGARCPPPPFECLDIRRWWVGWAPPVYTADSELVGSYAITVADADSGVVLEDHSFEPEYETVSVRDCDAVEPGSDRITCTHFVASWD
jgi:hypothetical protein